MLNFGGVPVNTLPITVLQTGWQVTFPRWGNSVHKWGNSVHKWGNSVSVWHGMAMITSCATREKEVNLPPFLESFAQWNSDPTLSINSACWWRRNGSLVAKEQICCWRKKTSSWTCSQICLICTIIRVSARNAFKTLMCGIYSSLQRSRSLPLMASRRVDLLIWVRKWSHGCRWVGVSEPTKSEGQELEKIIGNPQSRF